jgi:hypothetical protein
MLKRFLYFLMIAFVLTSCSDEDVVETDEDEITVDDGLDAPAVPAEVVRDILQSIPQPVEISTLIQQTGGKYNRDLLNPLDNANQYNSNAKKALNLGIYGADLGYTNIYGQSQDGVNYMEAVRKMANGLQIGQFFDFNLIKRLATNNNNVDSLLLITQSNFDKINAYLQEQNRSNLSLLIVTGGWLEGVYLICKVLEMKPNQELRDKIGEQKLVLSLLMQLLEFYEKDPTIKDLAQDLRSLNKLYENIKIIEEKGEPIVEIDPVLGIPMVKDNTTTTIIISDEQLKEITKTVNKIRSKAIAI